MRLWYFSFVVVLVASCSNEKGINYEDLNIEYFHEVPRHELNGAPYTGVAVEYFSDLRLEHHIKTGIEIKQLGFYLTGEKEREIFFQEGLKNCKCTMWWKNGNLLLEETYVDGNLEGAAIRYDAEGNEIEKKNYVNGMLELNVDD